MEAKTITKAASDKISFITYISKQMIYYRISECR